VFNRMIDTGSSSMRRMGSFADKSLAGTGTDSIVGYVFRGEGQSGENTSNSPPFSRPQTTSSLEQPLLRPAVRPVGGGYTEEELLGEAKEVGGGGGGSNNNNDSNPTTPPRNSRSSSPLTSSPHRPGAHSAYCLLSARELPEWFEPYGFAFEGYRVGLTTPQTWHSVFHCHNETQNIWTEFGPLFAFCVLSVWVMQGWDITRQAPSMDRSFILLCLAGSLIVRPLVSGLAHAFAQQSHRAYAGWWAADFVSICLAISCSSVLMARFTFYCQCDRQLFYIIGLVGLLTSTII
jgi:hypothetical protein